MRFVLRESPERNRCKFGMGFKAIHITQCTIFRDHGVVRYNLDFVNKTGTE